MNFTAKQISQVIQGRVEGDENAIVNTFTLFIYNKIDYSTFR